MMTKHAPSRIAALTEELMRLLAEEIIHVNEQVGLDSIYTTVYVHLAGSPTSGFKPEFSCFHAGYKNGSGVFIHGADPSQAIHESARQCASNRQINVPLLTKRDLIGEAELPMTEIPLVRHNDELPF